MSVTRAATGLRSRIHARASTPMSAHGPNRARSDAAGFAVPAGWREPRNAASDRRALPARRHVAFAEGRRAAIGPPLARVGEEERCSCAVIDGTDPGADLASIASWMS